MALPKGYAVRRDSLFERARELIRSTPAAFAEASAQLDEIYSEEVCKGRAPSLANMTGRRCLLGRLNLARADALNLEPTRDQIGFTSRFDFEATGDSGLRCASARRFVLVILLSGDFQANEAIQSEWGEIVSLPWENGSDDVLGRAWCIWPKWTGEGGTSDENPSPEILDRLEAAMNFLGQRQDATDSDLILLLSRSDQHWLDEFPPHFTIDDLRELDAGGMIEIRPWCWQSAAGGKLSPLDRPGWCSPIKWPDAVGRWDMIWKRYRAADTSRERLEIRLTDVGHVEARGRALLSTRPTLEGPDNDLKDADRRAITPVAWRLLKAIRDEQSRTSSGIAETAASTAEQPYVDQLKDFWLIREKFYEQRTPEGISGCVGLVLTRRGFNELRRCDPAVFSSPQAGRGESEMASQPGTAPTATSVAHSGSVTADGRKKRPKRDHAQITADNDTIRQYLHKNPLATRDQTANATGISKGHVSESRAWKAYKAGHKEARRMKKASEHGIGGVGDPTTDLGPADRDG